MGRHGVGGAHRDAINSCTSTTTGRRQCIDIVGGQSSATALFGHALAARGLVVSEYRDAVAWSASARRDQAAVVLCHVRAGDGTRSVESLRAVDQTAVVIALTQDWSVEQNAVLVKAGADVCVPLPCSGDVLFAWVDVAVRRLATADPVVRAGALALDPVSHTVALGARCIALTAREYAVLDTLVRARGRVVPRQLLEQRVHGFALTPGNPANVFQSNAIAVHISRIRRKLQVLGSSNAVRHVRGVGYSYKGTQASAASDVSFPRNASRR